MLLEMNHFLFIKLFEKKRHQWVFSEVYRRTLCLKSITGVNTEVSKFHEAIMRTTSFLLLFFSYLTLLFLHFTQFQPERVFLCEHGLSFFMEIYFKLTNH